MKDETQKIKSSAEYPFFERYHDSSYIESHGVMPVVTLEEHHRKYVLENDVEKELVKYKIDGGIFPNREDGDKKCDFAIYTEDDMLILVELKGSDYERAVQQLLRTVERLGIQQMGGIKRLLARVVLSKGTNVPNLRSSELTKLKTILKAYKGDISQQSRLLTEKLSRI